MTSEYTFRNKYKTVGRLLEGERGSLLDVGARDAILNRHLPPAIRYQSADVSGGCELVVDLERRLEFDDGAFDHVVALDVLEHVNNLHSALDELLRIARRRVIVALPNMAFLSHRLSFAFRGRLRTDKYDLSPLPEADRHRWLTTSADACHFMSARRSDGRFRLSHVAHEVGGSRPMRLISWMLLRGGMPAATLLCDRTIFDFRIVSSPSSK